MSYIKLLLIFMLFGLGTCKRDNNYSFVKLFDYNNVAKDRKITGIYFFDDTTVFLLGEDNRDVKKVYQNPQALLLRTFDGGKTFRYDHLGEGKLTCFNYSTDLKNIYMVKEHYIIDDKIHKISDILHSSDMGNSWEKVYSFSEKTILNLEFFNDSLGSITLHERGNLQLYKTKDGGKSWHKLNNPLLDGGIANVIDVKGMLWGIYSNTDKMIWKMNLINDKVYQVPVNMPSDYNLIGSLKYDVIKSCLYLTYRQKDFKSNYQYMIYCVNDGSSIDFKAPIEDFNIYDNYIGIVARERDNNLKSTYYYSIDNGKSWNKEIPKCQLLSQYALYGKGNFWSIAEYGDSILWPLMIRAVPNDNNTIVDSQKRIVIVSNKVETTAKRCYSPNHYQLILIIGRLINFLDYYNSTKNNQYMNRRIKKILENITDKEPDTFVEENKQKLELFAKTPHIVRLDYLSMRFVASFYLRKCCKLFWYDPNENNFCSLLDYLFYYYSSYIVYFSDSNRKNELVNQVGLTSAFLGVLTFFPKKESDIMLCILIERIEDTLKSDFPYVYYQDTILPESIVMYDKYYNKNNSHLLNIYTEKRLNPIYAQLIDNICTDDTTLFNQLIDDICIYHLRKCNDGNFSKNEFYFTEWQLIPTEILVLLRYRHIQGKNIKFITNELIKRFIPFLTLKSFMLSEETIQFREKLYNTYMEKVMAELENENITKIINL